MSNNTRPWAAALRKLCLKKLKDFGGRATARMICDNLGKPPELIGPRLSELTELGVIMDTGERVQGGRGRPQTVWQVVDVTELTIPAGVASQAENESSESDAPAWFRRYGN